VRAYRARAVFRQSRHVRRSRVRTVERPPAQRASLLTVLIRTARTLGRHALLFSLCALALVAGQVASGYITGVAHADAAVGEILGGIFLTVITCATFGDISGLPRSFLIERGFERSWAVILIGLAVDLFAIVGIAGLSSSNVGEIALAAAVLLMTSTLIFATVDATIGDESWWRIIPFALSRSILAGWRPSVLPRALIALAVGEMGTLTLAVALKGVLPHVPHADLWAAGIANALLLPPVQAFVTIVYLDAIGYERPRGT
jgi:hypothetical protein